MKKISRMTRKELNHLISTSNDEDLIEEAYDELDERDRDRDTMDWTAQDERAAAEERMEIFRAEM